MTNFVEQMVARRKDLGISQKDLAEISGVSLRTINAFENGSANPTLDIVEALLAPMGLTLTIAERVKND